MRDGNNHVSSKNTELKKYDQLLKNYTSGILSGVNIDPYYNSYGQHSSLTATVSGTTIGSTVNYAWDSGARPYTIGAANFSSSGALAYFSYLNKSDLPSATTFYNTYPLTLMCRDQLPHHGQARRGVPLRVRSRDDRG